MTQMQEVLKNGDGRDRVLRWPDDGMVERDIDGQTTCHPYEFEFPEVVIGGVARRSLVDPDEGHSQHQAVEEGDELQPDGVHGQATMERGPTFGMWINLRTELGAEESDSGRLREVTPGQDPGCVER